MLRKIGAAALAFGVLSAGTAQALEHQVMIVAGAFFPEITYVQAGDTVTFINEDIGRREVFSDGFTFVSPKIATTESWTLTITDGMPNEYFAKSYADGDTSGSTVGESGVPASEEADVTEDGKIMRGVLSFAPAPLEE